MTCNICGAEIVNASTISSDRETADCSVCKSSRRLRSLIALLSQEIFGIALALPEFPTLKGIRGIGMSDSPELAQRLAEKFDYTNTFYHQAPVLDAKNPKPGDLGRYDFILSSEVMEHVPPPVERGFDALCAMLKPDGLLLMTTPYYVDGKTAEHFPELYEFTVVSLGGRPVLVNRRRDGATEVFDQLTFHGGHGSTLEMRIFTDESLRAALFRAGFKDVSFFTESLPEFGIGDQHEWSLPIAARKGQFRAPVEELAREYREACRLAARKIRDLELLTADYQRHIAFHGYSHQLLETEMEEQVGWVRKVEAEFEARTRWAQDLERENAEAIADFEHLVSVEKELRQHITALEKTVERLERALWTRVGRKLGMLGRNKPHA